MESELSIADQDLTFDKNETYIPCDLDFSNIEYLIDELSNNINLRKKLVNNSLSIIDDIYSEKGKSFFLRKIKEIIS